MMTKLHLIFALLPWCGAFTLKAVPSLATSTSMATYRQTNLHSHRTFLSASNDNDLNLPLSKEVLAGKGNSPMELFKKAVIPAALVSSFIFFHQQPAAAVSAIESISTTVSQKASSSGFLQAFLLIFISELGDKTFFIAGLLAAKYNKFISFTGSIGALGAMTILCTILGQIFHAVPSSISQGIPFDDYIAVAAFSYFGLKTLKDAIELDPEDSSGIEEEKEEAEKTVAEINEERRSGIALILQVFSLVFAAEIGDRSFLATIALSAAQNPFSVATGAIAAHATATGIAVIGGALMSKYLSEKTIGFIGGSLFLLFAVTTAIGVF